MGAALNYILAVSQKDLQNSRNITCLPQQVCDGKWEIEATLLKINLNNPLVNQAKLCLFDSVLTKKFWSW